MFSTRTSFACSASRSRRAFRVTSSAMVHPVKCELAITGPNAPPARTALGRATSGVCEELDRSAVFHVERTYRLHLVAGHWQLAPAKTYPRFEGIRARPPRRPWQRRCDTFRNGSVWRLRLRCLPGRPGPKPKPVPRPPARHRWRPLGHQHARQHTLPSTRRWHQREPGEWLMGEYRPHQTRGFPAHQTPGIPVSARTTENATTEDGTSIPKDSTLTGHVSDAHAAGEGHAGSSMGIVFDKAVSRDGYETSLPNVGIQAVAAAEASAASSAEDAGAMMGAAGAAGMRRGGGLLGRGRRSGGGAGGSPRGRPAGLARPPGGGGPHRAGRGGMKL